MPKVAGVNFGAIVMALASGRRLDVFEDTIVVSIISIYPQALNPKPYTLNLKPETLNPEQPLSNPNATPIWVVVKIMVRFWIPILIRHLVLRVPKEDHDFDNLNPKP